MFDGAVHPPCAESGVNGAGRPPGTEFGVIGIMAQIRFSTKMYKVQLDATRLS